MHDIVDMAQQHFQYAIAWKGRSQSEARIKHAIWWALRETTALALKDIGKKFGGAHHTSVLHGINHARELMRLGDVRFVRWRDKVSSLPKELVTVSPKRDTSSTAFDERGFPRDYIDLNTHELVTYKIERKAAPAIGPVMADYEALGHSTDGQRLYIKRKGKDWAAKTRAA